MPPPGKGKIVCSYHWESDFKTTVALKLHPFKNINDCKKAANIGP
jgi:hypothetical protein